MSPSSDADGLPLGQRRRAYVALAAGTLMGVLDGTIANVALPTIAREMHVSPSTVVWVVSGFQLALTAALFSWSSIGQARGMARTWRVGVALFTGGSLLCAVAHSFPLLVVARMLQGTGGAGIVSLAPALLRQVFPREQLGRALGINSLVIATGVAAGPTIGGTILALAPWPWLFLINVPLGCAIALLTRGVFPPDRGHGGPLHLPSIVTSAIGFALIVFSIDGFARGEPRGLVALQFVVGCTSFGWFLRRQRHLERPMFAVDLFGRPLIALASLTGFLLFTGSALAIVALPFLFQVVMGATPLQSGLLMTPWPLTMGLTANIAGRLSDRYPAAVLSTLGAGILALGLALYAMLPADAGVPQIVVHGMLCGFGYGLFASPNSRELMADAPRHQTASAAAIMAASRVTGQTCGAAAAAVVFAAFAATLGGAGVPAHAHVAVSAALWTAAAFASIAALASSFRARFPRGSAPPRRAAV